MMTDAREQAKRHAADQAKTAEDKLEEHLAQGGFYTALAEFLVDLPLFPYACLKGPTVRIKTQVKWSKDVAPWGINGTGTDNFSLGQGMGTPALPGPNSPPVPPSGAIPGLGDGGITSQNVTLGSNFGSNGGGAPVSSSLAPANSAASLKSRGQWCKTYRCCAGNVSARSTCIGPPASQT